MFGASGGSQGKLHDRRESDDSAKLKKVGLDDECIEEVKEELGPQSGTELAAPPL